MKIILKYCQWYSLGLCWTVSHFPVFTTDPGTRPEISGLSMVQLEVVLTSSFPCTASSSAVRFEWSIVNTVGEFNGAPLLASDLAVQIC